MVHVRFGGVSTTTWHLVHLSRAAVPLTAGALMTEDHYAQTMQASLDDNAGKFQGEYSFEPCLGSDYIGEVRVKKTGALLRIFDADGLAPDLHLITNARFLFFWVYAASVWCKQKIYRPVELQELFAIWDYKVKLECQDLSWRESMFVLQHRGYCLHQESW
jgi:hypothetical protein